MEALSVLDNIAVRYINNLNTIYQEAKERYEGNKNIIAIADNETSDLLHEIELTDFNACRGWWLAIQLKTVRTRRRKAKDENELLNDFLQYINSKANESSKLNQIRDNSDNLHSSLMKRKYEAKVRTDLLCATKVRNEKYITSMIRGHRFNDGVVTEEEQGGNGEVPDFNKLMKKFKKDNKAKKKHKYK